MPEFAIEFDVDCSRCGARLDGTTTQSYRGATLTVEPCAACLEAATDEGDDKGYERGLEDGAGGDKAE